MGGPFPIRSMARKPATPKHKPAVTRSGSMSETGPTAMRVETLRLEVVALVNKGYSIPQAGAALGISRVRAWQLVKEEMEVIKDETFQEAIEWRHKETVRKENRMQRFEEIAERAQKGGDLQAEIAALAKADAISTELAKMWGAYAPARTDVTSNGETLEAQAVFAVPVQDASVEEWLSKRQ